MKLFIKYTLIAICIICIIYFGFYTANNIGNPILDILTHTWYIILIGILSIIGAKSIN